MKIPIGSTRKTPKSFEVQSKFNQKKKGEGNTYSDPASAQPNIDSKSKQAKNQRCIFMLSRILLVYIICAAHSQDIFT
jgi:hypothetical protein